MDFLERCVGKITLYGFLSQAIKPFSGIFKGKRLFLFEKLSFHSLICFPINLVIFSILFYCARIKDTNSSLLFL